MPENKTAKSCDPVISSISSLECNGRHSSRESFVHVHATVYRRYNAHLIARKENETLISEFCETALVDHYISNSSTPAQVNAGCRARARGVRIPSRTTHLAARQADADDITLGGFDLAKDMALLLVGHPACLLRIVGFRLVDSLLLEGDEEVWGRIGILALRGLLVPWHLGAATLPGSTARVKLTPWHSRGTTCGISSLLLRPTAGRREGRIDLSSSSSLSFAFGGGCWFGGGRTTSGGTFWAALEDDRLESSLFLSRCFVREAWFVKSRHMLNDGAGISLKPKFLSFEYVCNVSRTENNFD